MPPDLRKRDRAAGFIPLQRPVSNVSLPALRRTMASYAFSTGRHTDKKIRRLRGQRYQQGHSRRKSRGPIPKRATCRAAARSRIFALRRVNPGRTRTPAKIRNARNGTASRFSGRLAEIAGEYLRKGSQVYVEGRLRTRKWQDRDGNDRYTTEVIANEMQMLGGRPGSGAPARSGIGTAAGRRRAATGRLGLRRRHPVLARPLAAFSSDSPRTDASSAAPRCAQRS